MKRRPGVFHGLALSAFCALASPGAAQTTSTSPGQAWASRPIRVIVSYAPGGGIDIVTRTLAQKLGEQTGGTFVVENRPGGAEGIRVTDPNAVEGALRQGLVATKNKPALVEVMVADRPYPKI
jgi:tripartite-type tricarboxylate transporter receptor subunit TctC